MRPQRIVEDVSALPTYAFGPRMTMWWGTLGFCALEGMGFALAIGAYLYLVHVNPQWPLADLPPNHWPGTLAHRHPPREHLAEPPRRAPRARGEPAARVRRDLVVMSRDRRRAASRSASTSSRSSTCAGTRTPTARSTWHPARPARRPHHHRPRRHAGADRADVHAPRPAASASATSRTTPSTGTSSSRSWLPIYLLIYWVPRW